MRKISCLFLGLFLFTTTMNAQEVDSELLEAAYWDIGIEYGFDAGLGGNIGYTNLGVDTGRFSHGSISFLYKDDGIDRWGKDYTGTIGYNQFPEEIVDEGYSYLTGSLLLGLKIAKEIHLLGVAGYKKSYIYTKTL